MKKPLIALAALASFAGLASAQSSVTLFGVLDATLAHGHGDLSNKTQLTNSSYNSSRLGFRGTEDLGGGMSASFWLEAGVSVDDGQGVATNSNNQLSGVGAAVAGRQGLTFNRRSTVSLAGGWGELRLGRDPTAQSWNMLFFDPFYGNGVGALQVANSAIPSVTGVTTIRASNSIGYLLPENLGGFYGQVQYYLGENNSGATGKDGTGYGVRVGFAKGPFNIAAAASKTTYNTVGSSGVAGLVGDVHQNNIGGSWDFGVASAVAEYSRDKNGPVTGKGWVLGGVVPVGAGQIRLAYSRYMTDALTDPTAKKWALGYVYNLSKRTALYATYAHVSNEGTSAQALNGATTTAGGTSTGYDLGFRHSF
jgi:predicted porin